MDDIASQCKEFIRGQNARSYVCGNTTAYNFFKRFAETEGRGRGKNHSLGGSFMGACNYTLTK